MCKRCGHARIHHDYSSGRCYYGATKKGTLLTPNGHCAKYRAR